MPPVTIEIRRARVEDHTAICEIYSCQSVVEGTLQLPYPSLEIWKERLSKNNEQSVVLVACLSSEVVGEIGLYLRSAPRLKHVAHIGVAVHELSRQKGVGTALVGAAVELADNWLNLKRLELSVYTDNEPAIKLYKNFGFEIEGTSRAFAFRNGEYADAYQMARVK